jgi:hypothetical protein
MDYTTLYPSRRNSALKMLSRTVPKLYANLRSNLYLDTPKQGYRNYFDLTKYVELSLKAGKKLQSPDRYWQLLGRSGCPLRSPNITSTLFVLS